MPALEDLFVTFLTDEDGETRALNLIEDLGSQSYIAYGRVPEDQFIVALNSFIYAATGDTEDWKWPPVDYIWAAWDDETEEPFTNVKFSEEYVDGWSPVTRMMV